MKSQFRSQWTPSQRWISPTVYPVDNESRRIRFFRWVWELFDGWRKTQRLLNERGYEFFRITQ